MEADERKSDASGHADAGLWMVVAIIQPFRLDAHTLAVEAIPGVSGMTVSPCRGFGHEKLADATRGGDESLERPGQPRRRSTDRGVVDFTEKVKLEIAVAGHERADAIIAAIARTAHTGRRGDGKVFAWPITHALRVRTFDVGASAL